MKTAQSVGLIPRSGTINLFGRLKNLIFHEPNIDHLLFYRFLLLSKSYEMAHLIRAKKIKKSNVGIQDIDDVLKTYDLVGNIYELPFQVWWVKTGQKIFYEKKPVTKMTLTIDLSKGQSYVLSRVKKVISDTYAFNEKAPVAGIEFEVNKIRPVSLFHKFELVRVKAKRLSENMRANSNWKIALDVGFGSKYIPELVSNRPSYERTIQIREYLGDFVTRKLTEAKFISENAARGKFPCNKPLTTALEFDYNNLNDVIKATNNSEKLLLRTQPLNRWPLNYFDELAIFSNVDFFKSDN